ncbi:heterokaryon incompatibility protein-domain-containing protein [Podospora aff. communis PSN243]|uniref:Heterokaryon incompatibility protein-domain-containing protein n=1 Tax=Podospora aff. communis PSN243 TaxID=3040156 RepID=A0AAV9H7Y2_9PEZI|nr:heterokaryon incompatibility protein-domain-containing protein [Podospora aff. communis PSN243]
MNVAATFTYQPLLHDDSIRLLVLEPDKDPAADLRGTLLHTTINSCFYDLINPFTALSYCWGSNHKPCRIYIEGCAIPITVTLDAALRDMRDADAPRRIWADALCINQSDDLEKGRQVSMMDKIYRVANHTVIHLGLSDPKIHSFLESQMDVSGVAAAEFERIRSDILEAPWFTRVWVFQELVLSQDPWVQCGRHRVRWVDFCRVLDGDYIAKAMRLELSETIDHKRSSNPLVWMSERRDEKFSAPLFSLLKARRGIGATDPRDLVYANLGIVQDREICERYIKIDYASPVEHLFNDVARYIAETYGIDEALYHSLAFKKPSHRPALAPWAPDWSSSIPEPSRNFPPPELSIAPKYQGCSGVHCLTTRTPFTLSLSGAELDAVQALSLKIPELPVRGDPRPEASINDLFDTIKTWTTNDPTEMASHIKFCSLFQKTVNKPLGIQHLPGQLRYWDDEDNAEFFAGQLSKDNQDIAAYLNGVPGSKLVGRRLAIGEPVYFDMLQGVPQVPGWCVGRAFISLVPPETKEGDLIVDVGMGSRVLVLRPMPTKAAETPVESSIVIPVKEAFTRAGAPVSGGPVIEYVHAEVSWKGVQGYIHTAMATRDITLVEAKSLQWEAYVPEPPHYRFPIRPVCVVGLCYGFLPFRPPLRGFFEKPFQREVEIARQQHRLYSLQDVLNDWRGERTKHSIDIFTLVEHSVDGLGGGFK